MQWHVRQPVIGRDFADIAHSLWPAPVVKELVLWKPQPH